MIKAMYTAFNPTDIAASRLLCLFAGMLAAFLLTGAAPEPRCKENTFDGAVYTLCKITLPDDKLGLFQADDAGRPFGSFAALTDALAARGERLLLAMNAGMYQQDLSPVGLFVAAGKQRKPANTNDGPGNFHLKPNGVFYVADGHAGVMETGRFLKSGIKPAFATQSGPMLVIDGKLHPRFLPGSTSRKIRNGIGASADGRTVWFALSEEPVTFHQFARLFRDDLMLDNALFLDGTISSLYDAESGRHDRLFRLGPILGVTASIKN